MERQIAIGTGGITLCAASVYLFYLFKAEHPEQRQETLVAQRFLVFRFARAKWNNAEQAEQGGCGERDLCHVGELDPYFYIDNS